VTYLASGAAAGMTLKQDYWYKYDNMNRFTLTKGTMSVTNVIEVGTDGANITYNARGARTSATRGTTLETYGYSADGYLTTVTVNGALGAKRVTEVQGHGRDTVRINQRLYLEGTSGKYRIPDLYFTQSGTILNGTLGTRTLNTPQIRDFRTATGNAPVGIARPESYGGFYWIGK
jgi:hypothetical protein